LSATESVVNVNAYTGMYKRDRCVPSLSGTQHSTVIDPLKSGSCNNSFTFYVFFTPLKMFALVDFADGIELLLITFRFLKRLNEYIAE